MILRGMESGSLPARGMVLSLVSPEPVIPPRDRVFAGVGFGGGGEYITEWPKMIPEAGMDTDSFFLDSESLKRLFQDMRPDREEQAARKVGDLLSGIRELQPKHDTLDEVFEYLGDPRDPNSRFQKIKGYVVLGGSAAWSTWAVVKFLRKRAAGV